MQTHLLFPPESVHHASFFPQKDQFNEAGGDLDPSRNLLLAPHLSHLAIPTDWILYNAEQIGVGIGADPGYLELLRKHEVWDYSQLNIAELAKFGITAKHCPLGYSPCLERIKDPVEQDIDVLFYGSVNERRKNILLKLHEKCNLVVAFGVYGQPLLDLIARAKIIVNIHYYPTAIHEITRTSYLMANKKCIISEVGKDTELEKVYASPKSICETMYSQGIQFCEYDQLVDTVIHYLKNPLLRQYCAQMAYDVFKSVSQRSHIQAALGLSSMP